MIEDKKDVFKYRFKCQLVNADMDEDFEPNLAFSIKGKTNVKDVFEDLKAMRQLTDEVFDDLNEDGQLKKFEGLDVMLRIINVDGFSFVAEGEVFKLADGNLLFKSSSHVYTIPSGLEQYDNYQDAIDGFGDHLENDEDDDDDTCEVCGR